jgi:tetratricopeptide (TPR) repeat protein
MVIAHLDMPLSFERAAEIDAYHVWNLYGLGVEFASEGNYGSALAKFAECVQVKPSFMPARLQLAAIYYDQGNYPAAVSEYQNAIDGCRRDDELLPDLYFGLGDAYRAQGQVSLAILAYRRAINALTPLAAGQT